MYEIIVAGGGVAGVCGAVCAARMGADVCLTEKNPYLGGLATGGLVNPFMTHRTRDGKTKLVAGIFDEVKERLAEYNAIMDNCFDAEAMKKVLAEMAEESGVSVFSGTEIYDVIKENDIFSLMTDKGVFEAKKVLDTTGEGLLAYRLGCEYEGGDKGNTQAVTLMFTAENVDCQKAIEYCRDNPDDFLFPKLTPHADLETMQKHAWSLAGYYSIIEKHREEAKFPGDMLFFLSLPNKGQVTFNQTHAAVNNSTDREELAKAYRECERQMYAVMEFANRYIPGFENAKILKKADMIGVREARRIMGKYVFSAEDVAYSKKQEDCICRLAYPVDVHKSNGEGYSKAEGTKAVPTPQPNDWYEIPYRSLLTDIPDLLVAGKCISSDQGGHGAIRIIPACMATGQAAGTALALSVKHNCLAEDIDINELLDELRKQKALV